MAHWLFSDSSALQYCLYTYRFDMSDGKSNVFSSLYCLEIIPGKGSAWRAAKCLTNCTMLSVTEKGVADEPYMEKWEKRFLRTNRMHKKEGMLTDFTTMKIVVNMSS